MGTPEDLWDEAREMLAEQRRELEREATDAFDDITDYDRSLNENPDDWDEE